MFASGQLARGVVQYPAGRLSDRLGRRPVIVASVALYALAYLLYLLPLPVAWLIAVRFVHAAFAGFYGPAAGALMADLTPAAGRGAAFGRLQASNMVGLVLGPAIGGLVAGLRLDAVLVAGALICVAAAILLLRLPGGGRGQAAEPDGVAVSLPGLLRLLLPVALLGSVISYTIGAYDTVWSLYMTRNGATPFLVGISFTLFALPVMLLSGRAGALSDRLGSRVTAVFSTTFYGLFAPVYAFLTSVPALIAVGVLEATLVTGAQPAVMAEVSRLAPEGAQGRTQGTYQSIQLGALVAGALASGYLFSLRPAYAFGSVAVVTAVCIAASQLTWPGRSSARTAPASRSSPPRS